MTLLYRQKNTTRCKQRNTLSGNEQERSFLCFLQMQIGCQAQNCLKKQILHEMSGKFSFFFTFLLWQSGKCGKITEKVGKADLQVKKWQKKMTKRF